MADDRGHAPMNPFTLGGISQRHQHRRQCHHSDDFVGQQEEDFVPRSTSPSTDDNVQNTGEAYIRKKLKWFFTDPYQKYKSKGRKPWKLLLQIFKIILITAQAYWFAVDLQSVVSFDTDNLATFRHLFIKAYPGNLKYVPVFTKPGFYERMHYVWSQYHNFTSMTVGTYELPQDTKERKVKCCISRMSRDGDIDYDKDDFTETCHFLKLPDGINNDNITFFVTENNIPQNFEWVTKVTLKFEMKTKNWKHDLHKSQADCYTYNISASFNNDDYDGLMQFRLDFDKSFKPCESTANTISNLKLAVEVFVIILSIVSLCLCVRSFLRHLKLCIQTTKFFKEFRHEELTLSDKLNFVNFWIVMLILSDILVISGTIIKIVIDFAEVAAYDSCGLLLGVAVLFSWIGILRYLGFFKGYNTLLVTLKVSFPQVIRFIICAAIIYFGFAFCGWVVFGPYHPKFRDIIITSECLYSLVNGDDMFNTFKQMESSDKTLWFFSKVYLYVFISLFIFVVLSLFIGIISDTYERIKDYGHPPKSRIQLFMEGLEYNQASSHDSDSDSDAGMENLRVPLLGH